MAFEVTAPNGKRYAFPTQKEADGFQQAIQKKTPSPESQGSSGIGGFFLGAGKKALNTLSGLSKIGQQGLTLGGRIRPIVEVPEQFRTPVGPTETLGGNVEQLAELFVPGGAPLKAGKLVAGTKALSKAPGALRGLVTLGTRTGVGAATYGGLRAAQTGGDPRETAAGAAGGAIGEAIIGPALSGIIRVSGRMIQSIGLKGGQFAAFPMQPETARIVQSYQAARPSLIERVKTVLGKGTARLSKPPITEAETGMRQGLVGTQWGLGVQAKRAQAKLWNEAINPILEKSKVKVNMKTFIGDIRQSIIDETPDLSRRALLLKALQSVQKDYRNVSNFSLAKLQQYKEGWAKFIPEKVYQGKPISGALNEVRNIMAQKARETIYSAVEDGSLRQAYIDYGNLKSIAESGLKSIDPLRSRSFFRQAWELFLDDIVVPVSSFGAQIAYRTKRGLDFIGPPGAHSVGDVLGITLSQPKDGQ